jgi:uncharacterized protein YndB with AHSA1/START domain
MTKLATLEFEQYLDHPPAVVWQALTDPAQHAKWWAAGDVGAEVGHRFTLEMGPWGAQRCEVLEAEPEKLLRYTFAEGVLDSVLTWRLEPEGHGTRLFLTHAGLDLDSEAGRAAHKGMDQGWPGLLAAMNTTIG